MGAIASFFIAPLVVTVIERMIREKPPKPPPNVQTMTVNEAETLRDKAKKELGMDITHYNIGITGQSGSGKTSLNNSLRGKKVGDDGGKYFSWTSNSSFLNIFSFLSWGCGCQ